MKHITQPITGLIAFYLKDDTYNITVIDPDMVIYLKIDYVKFFKIQSSSPIIPILRSPYHYTKEYCLVYIKF